MSTNCDCQSWNSQPILLEPIKVCFIWLNHVLTFYKHKTNKTTSSLSQQQSFFTRHHYSVMIASHVAATLLAIFASPSTVVGDNLVGQGVASKTGYEYSDPPAIPSCGVEYGSVPNGVALRRSIIGDGSPPAMCGVCYRLTAAPELYDEVTYQFQGNTAIGGWTQVVQVVDTAPNNNPVLSHGVELEYVFDLPNSIFDAASDVHPGAAGLPPSGHIPLMYEQIACDDTPDTTTAATDPSSTTTTTSTIITEDPDELTINRENRCGVSEVDSREHCKDTCVSNVDCADGEYCWGVHANCKSKG